MPTEGDRQILIELRKISTAVTAATVSGATIPATTNLIKGDGAGNGADSGVTVDTDGALSANSDARVPTQKAVVTALSTKQTLDADLTAIAALTTTAFGRAILTLADAAALRSTAALVLGTDIYSKSAVDTLISGLSAIYQPLDADLTAIAALTTTANGRSLLTAATLTAAGLGLTNGAALDSWAAITRAAGFDTLVGTPNSNNLKTFLADSWLFYLAADGSAITTPAANFFGTASAVSLAANTRYLLQAHLYFTKTTSASISWAILNQNNYTNFTGSVVLSPATGDAAAGNSAICCAVSKTLAAGTFVTTASLTGTPVNHVHRMNADFEMGTAGKIEIQVVTATGSVTPLAGSYFTIERIGAANIGAFTSNF